MNDVIYQLEPQLSVADFADILIRSTLAERRPVDDLARLEGSLRHADLILTARDEARMLIGISRALTDFQLSTYLADLAVDVVHQGRGIGRALIARTHEAAGVHTMLMLLAAPKAERFYPRIGMTKHESCWVIRREARGSAGVVS